MDGGKGESTVRESEREREGGENMQIVKCLVAAAEAAAKKKQN